ncbi:MAG: hypothetical protein E6Q57_00225, partial [Mycobacterium sp.]
MTTPVQIDFTALLLGTLGYTEDEFVSLGYEDTSGRFRTAVYSPPDALAAAHKLPATANCYFGVNPISGPARRDAGRGTADDVTRVAALVADIDVKPGACATFNVAKAIAAELGVLLGTKPSVIVYSGGGIHAYWAISDGHITKGDNTARALLKRWGRLVAVVAGNHGVKLDSVYDLPRMLRLPGSMHNKTSEPIPVTAHLDNGGPLTLDEVAERLDEYGIPERPDDTANDTEPVVPPEDWRWADRTCGYVATMIGGYGTDNPKKGRNPWLLSQKVRLACAHRLGCITEADYRLAAKDLEARFAEVVASNQFGTPRKVKKFEFRDADKCAIRKAAAKTDEQARAELGDHTHDTAAAPPAEGEGRFFSRDGLRAKDLAEAVMADIVCGHGTTDQRFYTYQNGVWTPDSGQIEGAVARLLGNRYRGAHARNALDLIRLSPATTRITCDPVPQYINVRNGMLDWASGRLHPHTPELCSTVQLPIDYQPDADCPRFLDFIAQVLPEDCYTPTADSPGFIWEVLGYAAYSGNPLHIAILLFGKGRNGKGTLIRLLKRMLGERNCSTVGLHELAENRFRTATLFGKLANLAGDLDSRWLNNTAVFKAITGGDSVQGEHKYGAVFDFAPWALPFYSANKAFGAADSSEGWVARWVVIPFPSSFLGREDRGLDARLQADDELAGVFRRAAQALPVLMARGRLPEPDSVQEAKRQFVAASDAIRSWVDEHCTLEPQAWMPRPG